MTLSDHPRYADRACRGVDPNVFFPGNQPAERRARAYCHRCPVMYACREDAMESDIDWQPGGGGVRGALTQADRDRLRRDAMRRTAKAAKATRSRSA